MASRIQSERITADQTGSQLLVELINDSLSAESESDFLTLALEKINEQAGCTGSTLIQGVKGQWRVLGHAGAGDGLPPDMLADALDAESVKQDEGWTASPLSKPNSKSQLLACNSPSVDTAKFDAWTAAVGLALETYQRRAVQSRRATRLEAMLDMTVHWNQSRETDELLEQIAQTSTRLLGAERATIFLPDTSGTNLIGKPATGVEAGEILIPANAGVVGQVMQSGKPARVDSDVSSEQQQINRSVDEKLGFETRTILVFQ